jgi:hypothetical protein
MKKILTSLFFAALLLALGTGNVFAQETMPITGTVETVEVLPPDAITGETIVVVTILNETSGTTHTVNISLETAETLGLVTVDDTTGEIAVNDVIDPIAIDPIDILPVTEEGEVETETGAEHPVGSALGEFFSELLGIEYDDITEARDDGFGFGVIAQALWLTSQVEGDTDTFNALLEAKKTGDYSAVTLADGSTPENWGDVVKSLKQGENLGSVMSGKAEKTTDEETDTAQSGGQGSGNNGQGNGNSNAPDMQENAETEDQDKVKDKGNDDKQNNGNEKGQGKGNNNGKGNSDKGGGNGKGKP